MSRPRDTFRVSCKCALFSPDYSKVLVIDYGKPGYGLPGGHIDANETPDEAMARELFEELGLRDVQVEHADFLHHRNGKIVLGFIATLDPETPLKLQLEEMEDAVWVEVRAIRDGQVSVPSYGEFICKKCPATASVVV